MLSEGQAFDLPEAAIGGVLPGVGCDGPAAAAGRAAGRPMVSRRAFGEPLAFRIAIVDSEDDLLRVQQMRQAAYGHHLPQLAAHFGLPDPIDRWPDVTIFYAEDKETGRVVGSARLQCNASQPLQVERCVELPSPLQGRPLVEVTRLAVVAGYVHPVKLALVKAAHLFCVATQTAGVIAASRPSLLKQYTQLGFEDLFGDDRLVSLSYAGGLDHRVLFRETVVSGNHDRERARPGYDFVFRTYHPDIEVFSALARASAPLRRAGAAIRASVRAV